MAFRVRLLKKQRSASNLGWQAHREPNQVSDGLPGTSAKCASPPPSWCGWPGARPRQRGDGHWEGTRPLLVEIQALVDSVQGGYPKRVAVGLDAQRLAMHLAVLHRHAGVSLADQDVFANVVGGVRVGETGADLALILATLCSFRDRALPKNLVVFGELGLTGEVRPVPNGQDRIREAGKHGFTRAIVPRANRPRPPIAGVTALPVATLKEALDALDHAG